MRQSRSPTFRLAACLLIAAALAACGEEASTRDPAQTAGPTSAAGVVTDDFQPRTEELGPDHRFTVTRPGSGDRVAARNDRVTVRIHGVTLADGTPVEISLADRPIAATLDEPAFQPGVVEAMVGMRVGERRTIEVPAHKAYGSRGRPPALPPNADLVFDITLVDLEATAPDPDAD